MNALRPLGFRAAAAVAAVAVLSAALLSTSAPPERPQPLRGVRAAEPGVQASPLGRLAGRGGHANTRIARARARGMRTARRFAEHYLRWERGDTAHAVRAGIAAAAAVDLARLVLSAPPRIPPALRGPPRRARLLALHGELAPRRRRLDVAVELARGHARWSLQFVLRRSGQRWRVTRVHD